VYPAPDLVTIRSEKSGTRVIDSEGRVSFASVDFTCRGRVSLLGVGELNAASAFEEDATAVACVPKLTPVDSTDTVIVSGKGPQLDGSWKIAAVRHTPIHLRVLLRRP
jgi:hypothetical protein